MARKSAQAPAPAPADGIDADSKSARTRRRILDAAAHVLSTKGYAGTRLTDVAEHAELQAPAIYYYFPSREDLIEEVMWSGIADMARHLQSVLDELPSDISPLDRILVAVETHLRHELELSDYATASIRNSGQVPEHLRARQLAEEATYSAIWRKLLRAAHAEGQLRDDLDLTVAQLLIIGSLNWAAEWWTPRRGSVDSIVRNAMTFVRNAIAAPSADEASSPRHKRAR